MAKAPILDLDTLIERPTVRIDGRICEMLSPEELSILDSQRLSAWGREIDQLAGAEGKDEELALLVDKVARKVLVEAPPELIDRLSQAQRLAVVEVFTGLLLRRKMAVAGALAAAWVATRPDAAPPQPQSTGAKSSLGSSASSAAILAGGSPTPPAAS